MTNRRAFLTGITGQDGSYLTEFLLEKGYEVHGIVRRASNFNTQRIDHIFQDPHEEGVGLHLHFGDLTDPASISSLLHKIQPHEVYNLGAQSHVKVSFENPIYTAESVALGTLNLLEAVRNTSLPGSAPKIYQAGSSEMFGAAPAPQSAHTPFQPQSPYAVSKVAAHWYARNYREAYGLFACNGILFNHESPRRGETFVTRKITRALGRIVHGLQDTLYLGNLDSRRDWGFAGDYVEAMWRMLQADEPGDYVVATGTSWTVRDFLDESFGLAGLDWQDHVQVDPRYMRPSEVHHLEGDPRETEQALGWRPRTSFKELVRMMVEADLRLAEREQILKDAGHPGRTV